MNRNNWKGRSRRRGARGKQRAAALLVIFLLVSMACALPTISLPNVKLPPPLQPSPATTRLATESALPKPLSTRAPIFATAAPDQPPLLVEIQPEPGSQIPPQGSLTFYFSEAMDQESVQRGMELQPTVPADLKWVDDATLRLTPKKALPPTTGLNITFNNNVKAKNGVFLTEPVALSFQTAGPLQVTSQLPKPDATEVSPVAAIVASFNQPVVPLVGESTNLPPGFTLDPQSKGRGEWLNTSTYIFYPEPGLQGGTKYTAHLNAALTGQQGQAWSFTTAMPKVVTIQPDGQQSTPIDAPVVVTFNQPMSRDNAQAAFSLRDQTGAQISGSYSWNTDSTIVTFRPDALLARDTGYIATVSKAAQGIGGTALSSDASTSFQTVPALAVVSTNPAAGQPLQVADSSYGLVTATFSAPLDKSQKFGQLLRFNPPVSAMTAALGEDERSLTISGYFQPDSAYTLIVTSDLKDRWGQTLGQEQALSFNTSPANPSFTIPLIQAGANILFVTSADTSLPVRVTNLSSLQLTTSNLALGDFIKLGGDPHAAVPVQQSSSWTQDLPSANNNNEAVEVPLTQSGSALTPGLYYYSIASPQITSPTGSQTATFLVVASDIQLILKRSDGQLFVWAVNLNNHQPVSGTDLFVVDNQGQDLAQGRTDERGIFQTDLPQGLDPYSPLYVRMGKPGEANFSLGTTGWDWAQGVSGGDFGLTQLVRDDRPYVYLYTDRPIYQPGQTIYYRGVARQDKNGRYSLLDQDSLTVKILGVSDTGEPPVLDSQSLPLSSYGSLHGSFVLPVNAQPGDYTLRVEEVPGAMLSFRVANYRKPEIELQAAFSQADVLAGQDLAATLKASYYIGAPVGQLPVTWSLYASPATLFLANGYLAGKLNQDWMLPAAFPAVGGLGKLAAQGQGVTGPDGTLAIAIPASVLRDQIDLESQQNLVLEIIGQDESHQPVSIRAAVTVHPASFTIGVKADAPVGQAGSELGFNIQTYDWQRAPSGSHTLKAVFQKVVWTQSQQLDPRTGLPQFQPEYTPVGSTDFATDAAGQARIAFTPEEAGTYQLDVSGEGAITQVLSWVSGAGAAPWPNLPNQHLEVTADASEYTAGQSAHLFIPNPFTGNALALVTVERAEVMRAQIVEISGDSFTLDLPLIEDDAPNVYVSVTVLGQQPGNRPDFRQGYVELRVRPVKETLQVQLAAQPAQTKPGGAVNLKLQVQDADGKPVQGEFSLALVDKAALALAEANATDINDAFYGEQPLGVLTRLSVAAYARRIPLVTPGGGFGGGGFPSPEVRENFQDTAYWNAAVETDQQGQAQVNVTLPDNLTTWVVDTRGVTADTRTGQASGEVVTSKDLLVRPVTPRFFVVGDHVQLAAIVQNNTARSLKVDVSLQETGFTLDEPDKATQQVDVPAGGRQRVAWWGSVQDSEAVDLLFTAQAGNLQDAARPEAGKLPVLHYSAPQTFATSGMLSEAGKRLEYLALPRSFTPTGGALRLELSPSLAATVTSGLEALQAFPGDSPEAVLSRLLPDLAAYQTLKGLGVDASLLKTRLDLAIQEGLPELLRAQNADGGWGWSAGGSSDNYLTAYALFGLSQAAQAGVNVPGAVIAAAQKYLQANNAVPGNAQAWQLDRIVFQAYALAQSGAVVNPGDFLGWREQLAPWSKALLALILQSQAGSEAQARLLVQDLESSVVRSATGANWEVAGDAGPNLSSASFVTAVVSYALARLDPASPLLVDALRYLISNRQPQGGWASSYETAWALMAITEALKGTGNVQAAYSFSASLNNQPLADGQAESTSALTPVTVQVPLSQLDPKAANALVISREAGPGQLYYRAILQVDRPVDTAQPVEHGLSISRSYTMAGQECRVSGCAPVTTVKLSGSGPVLFVRLSLTLPHDMAHLVVEDTIPAGTEILNTALQTSQQGVPPEVDPADPFANGWGWWYFQQPQVYDTHIRWVADNLPAGTYQLTYRLVVVQAGEYRLIPARAYENYFPEVQGTSAGGVLAIQP